MATKVSLFQCFQVLEEEGSYEQSIPLGRQNWLFAGFLRAGKRATAILSLLHSARIIGHEPYACLKDTLE